MRNMSKESEYDLELNKIKSWIEKYKINKVLIQCPNGLKYLAFKLAEWFEEQNVKAYISSSNCWGACDIAINEAKYIGCEAIIHVGHNGPYHEKSIENVRIFFIPAYYRRLNAERVIEKLRPYLANIKSVGLVSSIQHVRDLLSIGNKLASEGINVYIGNPNFKWMYPGQVIGCNVTSAISVSRYVNSFICISGGVFHAIGVRIMTQKEVISYDPYLDKVTKEEIDMFLKRTLTKKLYNLTRAMDMKRVGILLCSKIGQCKLKEAIKVKHLLEKKNYKCKIIVFDNLTPSLLENFLGDVDFYINTGCPRIGLDDLRLYENFIIINLGEVDYLIYGKLKDYDIRKSLAWSPNF